MPGEYDVIRVQHWSTCSIGSECHFQWEREEQVFHADREVKIAVLI